MSCLFFELFFGKIDETPVALRKKIFETIGKNEIKTLKMRVTVGTQSFSSYFSCFGVKSAKCLWL